MRIMSNDNSIIRPSDLRRILEDLDAVQRVELTVLLNKAIAAATRKLEVIDLWDQSEISATYWILMMTSTDQKEEMRIAQTLLTWSTFSAKHSTRVICVPSSERNYFRLCSSYFGVVNCPSLILGNSPFLDSFIKIGPELLTLLAKDESGLQRFLTRIHSSVENGATLKDIQNQLLTEQFWLGLKLVYAEVKGFISVSISSDI